MLNPPSQSSTSYHALIGMVAPHLGTIQGSIKGRRQGCFPSVDSGQVATNKRPDHGADDPPSSVFLARSRRWSCAASHIPMLRLAVWLWLRADISRWRASSVCASPILIREGRSMSAAANPLQSAIDAGIVSWNGQKPVSPPPVKLRGEGQLVSEIVMEDRG